MSGFATLASESFTNIVSAKRFRKSIAFFNGLMSKPLPATCRAPGVGTPCARRKTNHHWGYMIRHSLGRFSVLSLITVSLALPGGVFGTFTTFSEGGDATAASILDTVNAFRAALGDPNNGNDPGPLPSGRREINWDGGGAATTLSSTPFDGFLNNRGARFTTAGAGFVQATPLGFEQTFGNTTLEETFGVFSPQRIFSPIGSNITDVTFFIPGTAGSEAATVSGFGAIFTDVDFGDSSSLKFYDVGNNLIFEGNVPAGTGEE